MDSKETQPYIYIYPFYLKHPSYTGCHITLSRVPYATVGPWWLSILNIWEMQVRSLGQEDPLEEEIATHLRTLAWEIPRTEEPGRLQSMGLLESDMT